MKEFNHSIYSPNHFKNYFLEYNSHDPPQNTIPIHDYTVSIHNAIFTNELYEVYKKYEKAVHKRDREED